MSHWAGEIYLVLTLSVLLLGRLRNSNPAFIAGGLLLFEWVLKNFLHDFGWYTSLPNVLASVLVAFAGYVYWFRWRHWSLAGITLLSVFGVFLHPLQSFVPMDAYTYAALINGVFALKLPIAISALFAANSDRELRDG